MNHCIAFLRGINLGTRRMKMDRLRDLFEAMKFTDVATYIASGNVIFSTTTKDISALALEQRIERHLERALGYEVDTFVRTRDEVAAIVAGRPFSRADMADPKCTILTVFLKSSLDADTARRLAEIKTDVDEFRVSGREFHWLCRIRMSDSQVWKLPAMRSLKLPTSSMRNLKTLQKLAELYPPPNRRTAD